MSRDDDRRAEREPSTASEASEARTRTSPAQFLREVRSELRKVAWPNRREVGSYTLVVLVVSLVLTMLIWGFDTIVREAVQNTI